MWRWMALGPNGRILHLVQGNKQPWATELKFTPICGEPQGAPVPTLVREDGSSECLLCLRRVLKEPTPP
jgi:hypothetical protein